MGLVVVSVTWAFLSPMPSAPVFALSGPHTAVNQSKSRLYLRLRIHPEEPDIVANSHPCLPQTQQWCLKGTGTPSLLPVMYFSHACPSPPALCLRRGTHLKVGLAFNERTSKCLSRSNSHTFLSPSPFHRFSMPLH